MSNSGTCGRQRTQKDMRWTLIASGAMLAGLIRFAVGHADHGPAPALQATESAAAPAPEATRPAPSAAAVSPPPSGEPTGRSILSLLEVGPAEIEEPAQPAAAVPEAAPAPTPDPQAAADSEAARRAQYRQDRLARRWIFVTLDRVVEGCAKQQLARNPRQLGPVEVEVAVKALPGAERGVLDSLQIETNRLYIPLFDACVRSGLASAQLARPASVVSVRRSLTIEPDPDPDESDDSEDADEESTDAAPQAAS
jgi:hypothetical protein